MENRARASIEVGVCNIAGVEVWVLLHLVETFSASSSLLSREGLWKRLW